MKYLVCLDDTDIPGTKGTGSLTQELCTLITGKGNNTCSPITRHQLFVHEKIPYTSHNSAMCFKLTLKTGTIDPVISTMAGFVKTRSEKGSDPGLCVARISSDLDKDRLISFGQDAKTRVLSKTDAYSLAQATGVHLSEHGGTGGGVIGALAGIGLRLSGNDGRYRGWYHLGRPGDVVSSEALCQYPFVEQLVTLSGDILPPGTRVQIGADKTKTVRKAARQVIVAVPNEKEAKTGIAYRTITKQEAKQY